MNQWQYEKLHHLLHDTDREPFRFSILLKVHERNSCSGAVCRQEVRENMPTKKMSHRFIAVAETCACIRALMRNKGLPRAAVVLIRHCLDANRQATNLQSRRW